MEEVEGPAFSKQTAIMHGGALVIVTKVGCRHSVGDSDNMHMDYSSWSLC